MFVSQYFSGLNLTLKGTIIVLTLVIFDPNTLNGTKPRILTFTSTTITPVTKHRFTVTRPKPGNKREREVTRVHTCPLDDLGMRSRKSEFGFDQIIISGRSCVSY